MIVEYRVMDDGIIAEYVHITDIKTLFIPLQKTQ